MSLTGFKMTLMGRDRLSFGPFEVDVHTHELWKFGTRIKLVGQPFEILAVLLSQPGQLVTREELRNKLWPGDTFVDFNHGLNAAVNKLRDALSDSAENPRYIETLPRRGYRFMAAVEASAAKNAAASPSMPEPRIDPVARLPVQAPYPLIPITPSAEDSTSGIAVAARTSQRRWPRYLFGAAGLAAAIFVSLVVVKHLPNASDEGAPPERSAERIRALTLPSDGSGGLSFSPDGNNVAFEYRGAGGEADAGIFVQGTNSDHMQQLVRGQNVCCPIWSPDGRFIAFSRYENKKFAIYVVAADGGASQKRSAEAELAEAAAKTALHPVGLSHSVNERKIDTAGIVPRRGEVDWWPDGKSLAVSAEGGIFLVSLENSGVRRLTAPPPLAVDWGPSFSPDCRKLLFVREQGTGMPDEIMVAPADGGEGQRIVSEPGKIDNGPQWSFDGKSVIFSSNRSGHSSLWRVDIDKPDTPMPVGDIGAPAWSPAVSRRGYRLAYTRTTRSLSIWRMDLNRGSDKLPHVLIPSTSLTDQGPGPQFSPDGKKLAYMSDRSGTMEIWVSNRDGSNPFQLTAVGVAGTPRWSPDSQSIVFDTPGSAHMTVMSIRVSNGAPRVLVPDMPAQVPSYSRDGKWVYFGSNNHGSWQVWKVQSEGGTPVQVTRGGGHAALETSDGKYLYYAKNAELDPEIWMMPVEGGSETRVPQVRPGSWASFQIVEGGILFVGPGVGHRAVLSFYDRVRGTVRQLAVLDRVPFWLGATADGKTIAFDQPGEEQAQIMLVDNFQ
jgi:Tol biopolymer transport system component/DNA-binding winged helix-turn-helix (wHTH) protein